MKKLVLTTLAIAGISGAAFAQGYVQWSTGPTTQIIGATNSTTYNSYATLGAGAPATAGLAPMSTGVTTTSATLVYYYELLYSTTEATAPTSMTDLNNNWTATGLFQENSASNGRMAPIGTSGATEEVDPSYAGGTIYLMIVGWSADLGTTFGTSSTGVDGILSSWITQAANFNTTASYFGLGTVGTFAALDQNGTIAGTSIYPSLLNPAASPLTMNELITTPEPGVMALSALGGASLLLFRRRK